MSDVTQTTLPLVGALYVDERGRELEITAVNPGDRLGRDICGLLSHAPRNGHRPREYATDLGTFGHIWSPT